jgi:hypothetical protein|tara:strand:+ start:350 stop:865 length:516 start_codon:yes stop_codon:yes gene_type:complete
MQQLRELVMSNRMVLCTGNPDRQGSIASGIREVFPNTTFIHRSNGYDLTKVSIKDIMSKHNCFINTAYIEHGMQLKLLNDYFESVKIGEVFNIGSTHEYDNLSKDKDYAVNKIMLRNRSLELNNYRINSIHIVLGEKNKITPIRVAKLIKWITEQEMKFPIIGFDHPKQAW